MPELVTADLRSVTAAGVKAAAAEVGFDLCGISPAAAFPELGFLHEWLDRGYHGEMEYLARNAGRRSDVRAIMPSAQSVIVTACVYNTARPYSIERASPGAASVARYAWGDDYHDVMGTRLDRLAAWLQANGPRETETRVYCDTGPVQERVYAKYAGLGWIGKNTCVINAELGSWLFLGVVICSLPLEPDPPALDQCGTCTLCLEACPTGAIVEPWVLDATKCLSYLTIELKGDMPAAHRDDIGNHVYGCDICQEVCPWNARPAVSGAAEWLPRAGMDDASIESLWSRTDEELRRLLKGSAMRRAGVRRLRRNLAVALGNSGTPEAREALDRHDGPGYESVADPLVASHVAWARAKLARLDG